MRRLMLLGVAVLLAVLVGLSQGEAQAGHVSCGDSISVDTTLDSDLTCSGTALTISVDNITLDLDGHTITGSSSGDGVLVFGHNDVTIKDGTISGFTSTPTH